MPVFRTLFTEMPYAAALKNEYLLDRCSTCFAKLISTPCKEEGCPIVYCSEQCRETDWPSHQFECVAFRQLGSTEIDDFIRLLARIVTRRMADNGIVHLCSDFPENIPDRCLDELMSHESEIEACNDRAQSMDDTLNEFGTIFKDTPLVDDWELLRRMYCVMWINCFSVSGPYHVSKGHERSTGLGFYLNTSRFNHACKPDLGVDFDGSSIIIEFPSNATDEASIAEERFKLTESVDGFNQLTISYGFSSGNYFPLRHQRRASLEFAYYFQCHCVLCDDENEATLEEHAAAVECLTCGKPYFWMKVDRRFSIKFTRSDGSKVKCCKSCQCPSSKNEKDAVKKLKRILGGPKAMVALEAKWTEALSGRMRDLFADEIVQKCEPVLKEASKVWHPSRNLRLAQLCERIFVSCNVLILIARKRNEPQNAEIFKLAFRTGKMAISWARARSYNTYSTVIAAYALDLARLYGLAASIADSTASAVEYLNRASDWFVFAASIWKNFGEKSANIVVALTKRAQEATMAAAEVQDAENKDVIM